MRRLRSFGVSGSVRPRVDPPLRREKSRDRAVVLPLVGLALLLPPVARIFEIDARIGDLPFPALYLFGVWAVLIVGALVLAPSLRRDRKNGTSLPTSAATSASCSRLHPRRQT